MQLKFDDGQKIKLNGKVLKFVRETADKEAIFEDISTGKVITLLERDILDKYFNKGIVFNPTDDSGDTYINTEFSAYPRHHREEALRRQAYCDAILDAGEPRPQALHWLPIIARVAKRIGDVPPGYSAILPLFEEEKRKRLDDEPKTYPSYLTLRSWLKLYKASDRDIRSLLPRHSRKGRKPQVRGPEESRLLDSLLLQFEKEARPSKAKMVRVITQAYTKANEEKRGRGWVCPSPRSLYRMFDKSNARRRLHRRHGSRAAVAKFDHAGMTPEALYPMEVVEIDHTWLNIHVIDKAYGIVLGRPWVTAAIDRRTKMPVGIYIGFEPPSIYSVCQCIKNMILPKVWMQDLYPDLPEWEAYGVPVLIVCDNGREFISQGFRDIAAKLGTTIRLAPVRNPEYKGAIESFLKTANHAGLSGLPGVTFSNPKVRGDYPAEKEASLTLDDLRAYLLHWLMAEYVWKRHSGINRVPGAYWREQRARWKPRLTKSAEELDTILGRPDTVTHRDKKGVVWKKIWYNAPELQELFETYSEVFEVDLRINDADLGYIKVIHPKHPTPIICKARNFAYASGLSLYHHLQIQKADNRLNDIDEMCADAVKAREQFHRLVEKWILQDTAKYRKHMRRYAKFTEQPSANAAGGRPDFTSSDEAAATGAEMMGRQPETPPEDQPNATTEQSTSSNAKKPNPSKRRGFGHYEA
jgi:putative transposase